MNGEIITTGNELISGRVADVNARYAATRLHEAGLGVQAITVLGDAAPLLEATLAQALDRSQFIIITGGLGPTADDITTMSAAAALRLPLHQDQCLLARIKECLKIRRLAWEERYARLALLPEGAVILDPGGMACGFSLKHRDSWLFFLPGVPREMQHLFDAYVLPALLSAAAGRECVSQRTLRFFGLRETELEGILQKLCLLREGLTVGYYPNFPENHLTLTARGPDPQALEAMLDRLTADLTRQVGDVLVAADGSTLEEVVGHSLRRLNLTLAVAESCSGGLISHRLTNVPGSSDYFMGGVVTYSNQAKIELLQVPAAIIARHGAVSSPTAAAMARGVRDLFHTPLSLSATGIAGPSGGSPDKPVGTVYLGLAREERVHTRLCHFQGNREQIKILTAQTALDWLRRELNHATGLSVH